jgi:hypothetical protein
MNRCVNQRLFCKALEKIRYLSIKTLGSQWTDRIKGQGNLAALIQTTEQHQSLDGTGWWLTECQLPHRTKT